MEFLMSKIDLERRRIVQALGALGAIGLPLSGVICHAYAAESLAATTFPGAWEESHRKILLPAFRKATNQSATLTSSQAVDTLTKLTGSGGNPPFEVVMLHEGLYLM